MSKSCNEQAFNKKDVLKNFPIFTEKHLHWSLFLDENVDLQSWNFIKERLQHRFFTVNIAKFIRTRVLENICEQLFERFPTWTSNITNNRGIKENIFSKTKKSHSKFKQMKKTYLFMMLLIISFSLYLRCMPKAAFSLHNKRWLYWRTLKQLNQEGLILDQWKITPLCCCCPFSTLLGF